MTEAERIARAQRAEAAYTEFFEPMIDALKEEYAHRIVTTLDEGMKATIADGALAQRAKIRADEIEKMSAPQRRLLGIAPF